MSKQLPHKGLSMMHRSHYQTWLGIKDRCYNKNSIAYKYYGGRGIRMNKRWFLSFREFLKDMGPRPSCKHTIDRIDNNKGYSKNNCRWATKKEQARNRRTNLILEFNGQKKCVIEWAEELGIPDESIISRLRRGWSIEKTLTVSIKKHDKISQKITFDGKTQTIKQWAAEKGLAHNCLRRRIEAGWNIAEALSLPSQKMV